MLLGTQDNMRRQGGPRVAAACSLWRRQAMMSCASIRSLPAAIAVPVQTFLINPPLWGI